MVLAIHSGASYLSESKAISRARGHWFMTGNEEIPAKNGAVMNVSQMIKAVMSSAAEAKLGALFINFKLAVPSKKTLKELGNPQPKTPMQTDYSTENGLLNNKITPKATKSIGMKFHWMRCRDTRRQFRF